jgi:hypothetical protein
VFSTCDRIYADLAIAIMETCRDPRSQIACLDDTDGCLYIDEQDTGLAFTTDPVPMSQGQTYYIYLGQYCDEENPFLCGELDEDAMKPSTILITEVACP